MKTLIITTKEKDNCYQRIREKWFTEGTAIMVKTDAKIKRSDLQSINNILRSVVTEGYRLCLPSCVVPELSVDDRIEYSLSLICAISNRFSVLKNELYVLFHSGDLFDRGDNNRGTGALYFDDIYGTPERMREFEAIVDENHLFRFSHNSDLSDLLLYSTDADVSKLCATIIDRIEQR